MLMLRDLFLPLMFIFLSIKRPTEQNTFPILKCEYNDEEVDSASRDFTLYKEVNLQKYQP